MLCGCTVERFWHDYGYDLLLTTYNANGEIENGEIENGEIRLQVKATDFLRCRRDGKSFSFRVETSDLRLWLREIAPVVLIIYDASREDAYWLYVQAYFEGLTGFDISQSQASVTISVPTLNKLNARSIRRFVLFRDTVSDQLEGVRHV